MKELIYSDDIARVQAKRITELEAENAGLVEENHQLRFEAGYLGELADSPTPHYFTILGSPTLLEGFRQWFYQQADRVFLVLGFLVAGGALVLAGQRLGWW